MKKSLLVYVLIIGVFAALIWLILENGKQLDLQKEAKPVITENIVSSSKPVSANASESVFTQFMHNIEHPLSMLLLQVIIILAVSRVFGVVFSKLGQQTVIGEIIAGIVLGPSLFGLFFPDAFGFLFPKDSLKVLQFLSQIGLAFFMFIIGMELDLSKIKNKAHDAVVVSHASIIFPYFLGVLLSYFVFSEFAPAGVSFISFSLFMGIAMSITAFPVLARIIQERKLTKTPLGVMAITCAAADDVTAWCILAVVIAIVKAGAIGSALVTIGLALVYVLFMLYIVKPFIKNLSQKRVDGSEPDKTVIAIAFFILLASAYIAEIIGIHALFGAFIAGIVMPPNLLFREKLSAKVEDISVLLLLPIFFAFTGLRTQIGLLNTAHLWAMCAFVIFVAILGKFGGTTISARIVGQSWKDSLSLGALMNTRGLMELIVLNIGYDLGILSPQIFAILVLMALCTTFITGPCLNLINHLFRKEEAVQLENN